MGPTGERARTAVVRQAGREVPFPWLVNDGSDQVGEVFALALGIAASPFPVVPAILLLFTARPRPTSLTFLGGWLGGIGLVTAVFALLAEVIGPSGDSPVWLSWVRIVVGVALVSYGVSTWVGQARDRRSPRVAALHRGRDPTQCRAPRAAAVGGQPEGRAARRGRATTPP